MLKKIGAASAITVAMLLFASPANAQDILPIDIDDSNVNFCHNDITAAGAAITTTVTGLLPTEDEATEGGSYDCTVWEDVIIIVEQDDDDHGHHGHHGHHGYKPHGHGHGHHDNDD
ncbi:hypothetical protein [Saccharothrix deserti]|uniref:hypothetical protein n=2 Tax=Saccharothrix deserti TaxID=2593674 RepID=UPI00131D92B7|nr:hypothetical protein [Saccharothrix deserti]